MEQLVCLFVCVALRPMSTAMVIAGRSVYLTTLFPGQAWASGWLVICAHTFACNWQQPFLNESAEGRRMTVEIISWSISTKVWDRAGIELATPGSAVRHASVARHVNDGATLSLRFCTFLYRIWNSDTLLLRPGRFYCASTIIHLWPLSIDLWSSPCSWVEQVIYR